MAVAIGWSFVLSAASDLFAPVTGTRALPVSGNDKVRSA